MSYNDRGREFSSFHVLVVEDDALVAAYLEGILLDHGIVSDSVQVKDLRKLALGRRYTAAVVGIDRVSFSVRAAICLLELCAIPVVLYTALDDPHGLECEYPDIPLARHQPGQGCNLAMKVSSASRKSMRDVDHDAGDGELTSTRH